MQETQEIQVQSLGQEVPLEKEVATSSSIPTQKTPWTGAWKVIIHGVTTESDMAEHTCMHMHTHTQTMKHYLAMYKAEILLFVTTSMDLQGVMLRYISQTEKDRYHMLSLICGIEKVNTYSQIQRIN